MVTEGSEEREEEMGEGENKARVKVPCV